MDQSLIWIDSGRGLAFSLLLESNESRMAMLKVPRNASAIVPSPSRSALYLLTTGKVALKQDQQSEPAGLTVIRSAAQGPRIDAFYPTGSSFDQLTISADESRAIVYHGSTPSTDDGVFRNPNELALIDLGAAPGAANPTLRTVRSFGSTPLTVSFSPEMKIGSTTRHLALILSVNYLTLIDLSNPTKREISLPLTQLDGGQHITPQEVAYVSEASAIFVRTDAATDLYAITLEQKSAEDEADNDFKARINQPSSGRTVRDMMVYREGSRTMILTVNAQGDLSLIDGATSEFTLLPMPFVGDTILPVPADAPTLALVYNRQQPSSNLLYVELAKLMEQGDANLQQRTLQRSIHDLVPVPGDEQLLVVHNNNRTVVSVLDLKGKYRTDTPIEGALPLESFDFVDGDYLVGVASGMLQLGILDLRNLHPRNLRLDYAPQKVFAVAGRLVVEHGGRHGLLTVLPDAAAERDAGQVMGGFLVSELLDLRLKD
jgi:hypothetical protein